LDSLVNQQDKQTAKKASVDKSSNVVGDLMKGVNSTIKNAPDYISKSTSFWPGKK
jgi:hypothetical protein